MFGGEDTQGFADSVAVTETVMVGPNEIPVERTHRPPTQPQAGVGAPMFDYMIDLETTGTNAEETAIIQLAAVRFNRITKEIDHKWFDRCMVVPPGRYWDEDTREWWLNTNPKLLAEILQRGEDTATVMKAFVDWVNAGSSIQPKVFWAKPLTFDFVFIASYLRQFGHFQPFSFREAVDLNSYLLGRGHENRREFWKGIEPVGDAHNAINDCLYQIRAVINA